MNTGEQMSCILKALKGAGWTRVNGNTWRCPAEIRQVKTAYAHCEATLELWFEGRKVDDYRGSKPLIWLWASTNRVHMKDLEIELANMLDRVSDML